MMNKNLIFDVGFHVGQDTVFYLKKGFWVVAVDANPLLIEEGKKKFAEYINAGRLILLNVGIGQCEETLPFYVNKQLSEWSSFDKAIGTSRGDYYVLDVPLVTLRSIAIRYGVPYYIKIDIEGNDMMAIKSLRDMEDKPRYISVENGQTHMIEELYTQGYRKFKFVNQARIQDVVLPSPVREGEYIEYRFPFGASGPFGEEIDGPWLDRYTVIKLSTDYWGNPDRDANIHGWYDLHAAL
jgi:FkbM family methyltransferase